MALPQRSSDPPPRSSATPGSAAATQYQGSSVSPASPQQALGPCHSHQILRLCIFHQHRLSHQASDRQAGTSPYILPVSLLITKRGHSKDTSAALLSSAQLCSSPSRFEGCSNSLCHCYFCCQSWGLLRDSARHCLYKKMNISQYPHPSSFSKKQVLLYFQKFLYFETRASTHWS